jgi:hypothetical protein
LKKIKIFSTTNGQTKQTDRHNIRPVKEGKLFRVFTAKLVNVDISTYPPPAVLEAGAPMKILTFGLGLVDRAHPSLNDPR